MFIEYYHLYIWVFVNALFLSYISTNLILRLAIRIQFVDYPDERKIHQEPMPYMGGVAVILSVIISMSTIFVFEKDLMNDYIQLSFGILMGTIIILVVGLIDDLRGSTAKIKFLTQIGASWIVFLFGVRIDFIGIPLTDYTVNFPVYISWFFTVLWIVGITNAINLIDGLDGLAAGITAISAFTLFVSSIVKGDVFLALLMISLVGAIFGFLKYNFNPAKIFLGDAGSLAFGFILGIVSVMNFNKSVTMISLMIPLTALAIPIIDTMGAIVRRFRLKENIFKADKKHIHHRLLDIGLTHKQVVLLLYFISLDLSIAGMMFLRLPRFYLRAAVCLLTTTTAVLLLIARSIISYKKKGKII